MPAWLHDLFTPSVVVSFSIVSVALLVGSVFLLPYVVARLPADYFQREDANVEHGLPYRIGKNLIGGSLLIAGVAMLFLPGQGILTLFVSLLLLDFPGKRSLERRIARVPRVLAALNRMRQKRGRPPLAID